jgi:hypothetical protein
LGVIFRFIRAARHEIRSQPTSQIVGLRTSRGWNSSLANDQTFSMLISSSGVPSGAGRGMTELTFGTMVRQERRSGSQ